MWQKSENKRTSAEATLTDSDDDTETTTTTSNKQQYTSSVYQSNNNSSNNNNNIRSSKIFNAVSLAADSINKKVKNETEFINNLKHKFDNEEEEQATSNKKFKTDNTNKPSFAEKMMNKMGHEKGKGLGKNKQGIVQPIDESDQKGKYGLGFKNKNQHFTQIKESWNYENDLVTEKEEPDWLEKDEYESIPSIETLKTWKKIGQKKRILDDEDHFCSKEILKDVLDCKSKFDELENPREMLNARSRANPFESIAACFFQNRAAMKMANIDAVFNFMFTDPKNYKTGQPKIESDEPLYFCDVCAGPGGFSEYILWRKKWNSKGFGFTLKEENDFCLDDFLAGSPEYFETHYGVNGKNGNGDVTITKNLEEFKKFVLEQTKQKGVHFMMADGGFSVEGNENIQEILSKQLYLCQFLCALMVLRSGGNFVCKLFDIFTPFSVGLVYLLYLCFDRICIHKPVTSRPANSERYIICEGAHDTKSIVEEYLLDINESLNKYFRDENSTQDVDSIVPLHILKNDEKFFNYISQSNIKFGEIQCVNLRKIQVFTGNRNLYDMRQSEMYELCLNSWKIPNLDRSLFAGIQDDSQQQQRPRGRFQKKKAKYDPNSIHPDQLLNKLYSKLRIDLSPISYMKFKELDLNKWDDIFKKSSVFDYKCAISSGNLCLLLGCGRSVIYQMELTSPINCLYENKGASSYQAKEWKPLEKNFSIELPRDTLVLAEKCIEYIGTNENQQKFNAIHIIDAFFIEGENMIIQNNRIFSLKERNAQLNVFVKSITKNSRPEMKRVRAREVIDLENCEEEIINKLNKKKRASELKYSIDLPNDLGSDESCCVFPSGMYIFKDVASPWSIALSRSQRRNYYYNSETKCSTYELPMDYAFYAHPKSYLENGFAWKLTDDDNDSNGFVLTMSKLAELVEELSK